MESENKEILELFIITYNRSVHLYSTLQQLVGCPFVQFPITILDNCSEDNTHEVYKIYKEKFPRLNYIKNKINIGGDANVLRAAELSNGVYTWILCDDDNYDFTDCYDVLAELRKGEVDAIMVGWSKEFSWSIGGICNSPTNLMEKGFPYFSVPTFVPGSIFKTDPFQAQIRISYTNIVNLLPVMTYYISLYDRNRPVYVSKNKLVAAMGQAGYHHSYIRIMIAVINTFRLIKSPIYRRKAFYSSYLSRPNYMLLKQVLLWYESGKTFSILEKWYYFKLLKFKEKILFVTLYMLAPILEKVQSNKYIVKKTKTFFN